MTAFDIEIRKLDCQALSDLSDILENNDDWKRLMAIIPSNLELENCGTFKYNGEHFGLIECAKKEQTRPCTAILIEEWGTSGKVRPRLSTLRQLLVKAQLFRGADYVSKLLKVAPPERPPSGPAALVAIPNVDDLPIVQVVPTPQEAQLLPPIIATSNSVPQANNHVERMEDSRDSNIVLSIDEITSNIFKNGITEVPYELLVDATSNFSDSVRLGIGACGTVYLGKFQTDSRMVAVKRLHKDGVPGDPKEQFRNEVTTFSKMSHSNIITLLGFCCERDSLCLVYPFMKNGSLNDILASEEKRSQLHWKSRFDIAAGVGNGIAYLHSSKIIHRDIKSANVLLDDEMQAKVGDFGLIRPDTSSDSRSTIITNTVIGTKPYMAWEAFSGVITDKMDVFSFGVVLLELMTGLPALIEDVGPLVDYIFEKKYGFESSENLAFVEEVIDKTASNGNLSVVADLLHLALDCLANDKNSRPNMIIVTQQLQNISQRLT